VSVNKRKPSSGRERNVPRGAERRSHVSVIKRRGAGKRSGARSRSSSANSKAYAHSPSHAATSSYLTFFVLLVLSGEKKEKYLERLRKLREEKEKQEEEERERRMEELKREEREREERQAPVLFARMAGTMILSHLVSATQKAEASRRAGTHKGERGTPQGRKVDGRTGRS